MPIEVSRLVDSIVPEHTILLFGAGASAPSGVPSASALASRFASAAELDPSEYSLSEVASLYEQRFNRSKLIQALRAAIVGEPTGGVLNLPLYDWRSLFTTNYDTIVEQCYRRASRPLTVYSSDFDFTVHPEPGSTKLFKLHGTIDKDIVDGVQSRIILTETDYDHTSNYRNGLYDRLKGDLVGGHLVVIGHSLQDRDIRDIVNRAAELGAKSAGAWRISLLLFVRDEGRASLFERRGFSVCFGGIDEFFEALAAKRPVRVVAESSSDSLGRAPALRPVTTDVAHASMGEAKFDAMFNGWPATHADIVAGLTFDRKVAEDMEYRLQQPATLSATLLGASGVGKTTAARQTLQRLVKRGFKAWEHKTDHVLNVAAWTSIATELARDGIQGVLFIDEAHSHLHEIGALAAELVALQVPSLKLLCVSTRNHWAPRAKSPYLFKLGSSHTLDRLSHAEIDRLLRLVDSNAEVRRLVEGTFSGFSAYERKRRLVDRCASEMFVCLKNIFASEKFDDIILREYAGLDVASQEVYKIVAALESSGIRVHRQLVIRLLGIPAEAISATLTHLADIVHEYTIDEREGLYGWRSRHQIIASIVSQYKYPDPERIFALFDLVVDNLSPTYEIEVHGMRELCNLEAGIPSIPDKSKQNTLLRKLVSVVPGERVPRHRLIRNLIEMGEFEKAETEIRIFEKDFKRDGPVARYKIKLLLARARSTPGILEEDRTAILTMARPLAERFVRQFPHSKSLLVTYCELGLEILTRTGDFAAYDAALTELRAAEDRLGDPDIPRLVARFQSKAAGYSEESIDD